MCIRDRSYITGLRFYIDKIDITTEFPVFIPIHTDIDDNSAGLYHISGDKLRAAYRRNKDIRLTADFRKIFRFAVANRHGLSLIHI